MSRDFDLSDILTITDGALVSNRHMDGVYDILNFMTDDNLFTHVLPRAAEACRPVLLAQHRMLADVPKFSSYEMEHASRPVGMADKEFFAMWVDDWVDRVAENLGIERTLPVQSIEEWIDTTPVIGAEKHRWHSIDPISEMAQLTERPDKIIVVAL